MSAVRARDDVLTALKEGRPAELADLLDTDPGQADAVDETGTPLLVIAVFLATAGGAIPTARAEEPWFQVVDVLLEAGATPGAEDATGSTALHTAAQCGHPDLMARLLAAGAPLEGHLMGTEGGSPLALTLFYAGVEHAHLLEPVTPDNIRHAAAMGRPLGRFLSARGELRPQPGLDFYRPTDGWPVWTRALSRQEILDESLTWAARNGQLDSMSRLVQLGADVNSNPYRGTALLWACYADHADVAAWLLDRGADPDLRHDFGGSEHGKGAVAMHLSAQFGGLECLSMLLDRGADATIADAAYGGTPLGWAEFAEQAEAAQMLKDHLRR